MNPKPKMPVMKEKRALPWYGTTRFAVNARNSGRFRKQNTLVFLFIKLRNYLLGLMAYTCPVNSFRVMFHRWRGVHVGKNVFIGMRCTLDHAWPDYIYLEDNVILSGDVYIVAHNRPSVHFRRKVPSFVAPVVIRKNCFVGVRAVVLPGVTIGEGSFISGGAVVTGNVPDHVVVQGNPGVVIHRFNTPQP